MSITNLRLAIIGLLMFTGVFHFAAAMTNAAPGFGWQLVGFGVAFTAIGFYVRRDTNDGSKSHSRNAIFAAIFACLLSLGLGIAHYAANGGAGLTIIFIIDAAIIAAACLWVLKMRRKS